MTCGLRRRARPLAIGFVFATFLAVAAAPVRGAPAEGATGGESSLSPVFASSKLARTGVAQTGGAISARLRSLRGGRAESPLSLAPDRRVRLWEFGNGGTAIGEKETKALAAREGVDLRNTPESTPLGVWVDGAWSRMSFSDNGSSFKGQIWSGLVGLDFEVDERLVLGIAGRYEGQNFDTGYRRGKIQGSGIGMAPYLLYDLSEAVSLDLSGGYTRLSYIDTHEDTAGGTASGFTGADRWFAAGHLNFAYPVDRWRFDGRVGTLYAGQGTRTPAGFGFGDQMTAVGDLRLGYEFDVLDGLEPYVSARSRFTARDGVERSADGIFRLGASLALGGARLRLEGSTRETNHDDPNVYAGLFRVNLPL